MTQLKIQACEEKDRCELLEQKQAEIERLNNILNCAADGMELDECGCCLIVSHPVAVAELDRRTKRDVSDE